MLRTATVRTVKNDKCLVIDASEKSGLSLRTIQRIENGESERTGDTLKRLSNALDVNPDELIGLQKRSSNLTSLLRYRLAVSHDGECQ